MKRNTLVLFILALSLSACAAPAAVTPAPISAPIKINTSAPSVPMTAAPVEPQGKLRAPSFESQTYINEAVGFALEYPAQWTVKETLVGERGSQAVLLSKPEIADLAIVPAGETRVAITVYQWDPKNDLTAFVETRKTAWEASGFTILDEEPLTLDLGLAAVRFTVQTSDGFTVPFLFAAIGDQYLSISGEGDLALMQDIMQYLRPVSQ
ncbi:MAG: hypothetical protein ABI904_08725 [Chloroflexota bacterium]